MKPVAPKDNASLRDRLAERIKKVRTPPASVCISSGKEGVYWRPRSAVQKMDGHAVL
jgi:hypothetical protein